MASPGWLPQEVQSSTTQASVSASPVAGPYMGPSTTPPTPVPVAGTPTSKGPRGTLGDSLQEATQPNIVNSPGYAAPPPLFSYNVLPNVNSTSGSSQQASPTPIMKSKLSASSALLQPPVPGLSASSGPSFSYNILHASHQLQSGMPIAPGHSEGGKNTMSAAASLQPPVPGQSARPNSFVPGTAPLIMPFPVPSSLGVLNVASSNAVSFSFNGNPQSMQKDQTLKSNRPTQESGSMSSTPSVSQSVSQPAYGASSSATAISSTPNLGPPTLWAPTTSFYVPPGISGAPVTPGPPGIASSAPSSSNVTAPSTATDSSSALPRHIIPTTTVLSNPDVQHQAYPPYPSVPPVAAPSQGLWLQPPQISSLPRPPFVPYPAAFSAPFALPGRGMLLPSVPLPDSRPPGVTPLGSPASYAVSGNQSESSGMQRELPPGIDNSKHANDVGIKDGAAVNEQVDAWTAHKTETGAVYYYNSLTGESTYKKPAGFIRETDKVTVEPTPVSWGKLAGTDWEMATTNDGKRYYYNTKTKLSSWQIPTEVTEGRKLDSEAFKEQSKSVPNTNILTEKGSSPVRLSAPAVNTGGRDATALRALGVPGSSSALDLIKKKLQESGAPVTSSPIPALSGQVASELNGPKSAEAMNKGLQSENSKDKIKDANGDGNISDSSSDSEDVDSGPSKEECIIQFKEMLKERGVAPFSKWDKELPKIVFDPRFKAIPNHNARRALFEHYVRTRAEEERKEKRAAQKAAMEGFKQLLDEAKEDIAQNTDYHSFKRKWGHDPRFEALDRKEREVLLNERVLPLKRAAEEKTQAIRAAVSSNFKSMLRDKGDITTSSRWSRLKDNLRDDPRYKSVKHEDRELLFYEYISELKAAEEEAERSAKAKREEQEKLKDRERELRKRKEREEQEVERMRSKARRKEAVESYQALLVETIKDPQASWTDSKSKLEKDPQGRATNPFLDQSDLEKFFREHVKILHERSVYDFRALLADVITTETAAQAMEDGKTILTSWSTAKRLLKADPRYAKMPRKERESQWRRYAEDLQRRLRLVLDQEEEKLTDARSRSSIDSRKYLSGSRLSHERR
ncbi:pre-mRNA-processing protein 40C isoform X2 [Cornus florida]|uniref:pre-mRNA-processing protein 40C isoform X2 n=1 Tax=Cornus florida TaxID=4283 RepID=UPI00289CA301|nr:pre-mRNA-processing protein 40C isoform X2 [Cornus florida]